MRAHYWQTAVRVSCSSGDSVAQELGEKIWETSLKRLTWRNCSIKGDRRLPTSALSSRVLRMQHLMRASLIHMPSPKLCYRYAHASNLDFSCKVLHDTSCLLVLFQLSWCKVPVSLFLYSLSNSSLEDWASSQFWTHLPCRILAYSSSIFLLLSRDARETQGCIRPQHGCFSGIYLAPSVQGQTDSCDGTAQSQ